MATGQGLIFQRYCEKMVILSKRSASKDLRTQNLYAVNSACWRSVHLKKRTAKILRLRFTSFRSAQDDIYLHNTKHPLVPRPCGCFILIPLIPPIPGIFPPRYRRKHWVHGKEQQKANRHSRISRHKLHCQKGQPNHHDGRPQQPFPCIFHSFTSGNKRRAKVPLRPVF